jgi:hypothetical protein
VLVVDTFVLGVCPRLHRLVCWTLQGRVVAVHGGCVPHRHLQPRPLALNPVGTVEPDEAYRADSGDCGDAGDLEPVRLCCVAQKGRWSQGE